MALCKVCKNDRFLIYHIYNKAKLDVPRCIGCIVRFPPIGIEPLKRSRPWMVSKYHAWVLIRQTDKLDVWKCPRCALILFSPKLGLPFPSGCIYGTNHLFRKGFWASVKLHKPLCPLCHMDTELMVVPRLLKHRPGRIYFPFSCPECNA